MGQFSSFGDSFCSSCLAGQVSSAASPQCITCPEGTFANITAGVCDPCAAGTYAPTPASVACLKNPVGTISIKYTSFSSVISLPTPSAAVTDESLAASIGAALVTADTAVAVDACLRMLAEEYASDCYSVTIDNVTGTDHSFTVRIVDYPYGELPSASASIRASLAAPAVLAAAVGEQLSLTSNVTIITAAVESTESNVVPCPTFSIVSPNNTAQCACNFGYYDSLMGTSLPSPVCLKCPKGGLCESGFVAADEGYWRETQLSPVLFACREGRCLPENITGPLNYVPCDNATACSDNATSTSAAARRRLFVDQAQENVWNLSSSAPSQNCVEGRTGPLCGLCVPGYSVQGEECLPCKSSDAFTNWPIYSQALLIGFCVLFALPLIAVMFLQDVSPTTERFAAAVSASASACTDGIKHAVKSCFKECFSLCCCCCLWAAARLMPPKPVPVEDPHTAPELHPPMDGHEPVKDDGHAAVEPAPAAAPAHRSELSKARGGAANQSLAGDVALATNIAGIFMELSSAEDSDEDDDDDGDGDGGAGGMMVMLEELGHQIEKMGKALKQLTNFYQICR